MATHVPREPPVPIVLTKTRQVVSTNGTNFSYTSYNELECPIGIAEGMAPKTQPSNRIAAAAMQKLFLNDCSTESERFSFGKHWFRQFRDMLNSETDIEMQKLSMNSYSAFHLRMSKQAFVMYLTSQNLNTIQFNQIERELRLLIQALSNSLGDIRNNVDSLETANRLITTENSALTTTITTLEARLSGLTVPAPITLHLAAATASYE